MPMRNYCLNKVKQRRFLDNFSVRTRTLVNVCRLKDKITYVKFLRITHVTTETVSILFLVHINALESKHSLSNNSSSCARHSRIFNSWSNRKSCSSWGTQSTMYDGKNSDFSFFLIVSSDSSHNKKYSWSNEFCSESVSISSIITAARLQHLLFRSER